VGVVRIGLVVAAVVAAAIAINVALLSLATGNHDPVGRLSPVVAVQPAPAQPIRPPASPPIPPQTEPSDGADD
jgi:hypothetical protein